MVESKIPFSPKIASGVTALRGFFIESRERPKPQQNWSRHACPGRATNQAAKSDNPQMLPNVEAGWVAGANGAEAQSSTVEDSVSAPEQGSRNKSLS
jgi:hypothetical protein